MVPVGTTSYAVDPYGGRPAGFLVSWPAGNAFFAPGSYRNGRLSDP